MSLETLWAPWRLDYIKNPDRPSRGERKGCFFCQYRDEPDQDRENLVVARTEHVFVVLNRFPYNNGHLMVAPLAHKGRLEELDEAELLGSLQEIRRMIALMEKHLSADGFNVGLNLGPVAGAGVPGHLHWHLVPRWKGDANFMTVLADTRVIPQSLAVLYDILTGEP